MLECEYPGTQIGGGLWDATTQLKPGSPFPKEINPILPSQLINTK